MDDRKLTKLCYICVSTTMTNTETLPSPSHSQTMAHSTDVPIASDVDPAMNSAGNPTATITPLLFPLLTPPPNPTLVAAP